VCVNRFWLVDFFPLFRPLIFTEFAHSLAHKYFSILITFMFLQGGRAFALKIAHLKDSELRKLAVDLPLRTIDDEALIQIFFLESLWYCLGTQFVWFSKSLQFQIGQERAQGC